MPQQKSASLSATGLVAIQPDLNDAEVRATLTGTYTGVQGKVQGSLDGVTYVDLAQVREDTAASVTGKVNASAANLSIVARVRGWPFVQFNLTDLGSGTVVVDLRSGPNFGYQTTPVAVAAQAIASNSANALAVGPNGTTSPAFNVDGSTASSATGVQVKSAAAGAGVAVSVLSSGAAEFLTVDAKGAGRIVIGGTSTGFVSLGRGSAAVVIFSSTKASLATQNITPTAAQLLGGYVSHASTTGAGTATLDTAANIDAAIPGVATGDSFQCAYANTGSQTVTITTAAGLSLKGTVAVPSGKNAILDFFRTGAGTWDVVIDLSA